MIIDFHTHIYPQAVAAKIFPTAKKKLKVEVPGSGAPEDLCCMMQAGEVSRSVLLPLAKGCHDVPGLNDWILSVAREKRELTAFGAVHPFMDELEAELDRLAARGVRGVKMMPLLQQVYPDDPECDRFYEALIERDMILVAHAGRDPLDRPEVFGTPERFSSAIQSYPDLKVVLAHLGGLRMWDDVRRHLLSLEGAVYFDTAYVSFYMGAQEMGDLIREIGPERVIFGSDYPWEKPGRAAEIIRGLGLSGAEEDAIFFKNAAGLLDLRLYCKSFTSRRGICWSMKRDLLDILACPLCKGDLTLEVFEENEKEIVTGKLCCPACRECYPIEDAIPNMLPPDLRD